jgi:hypothetical protein
MIVLSLFSFGPASGTPSMVLASAISSVAVKGMAR